MKIECPYPDMIIFLDVSLDVIRKRIRQRGRIIEKSLIDPNNKYLEYLQSVYENFCCAMLRHTSVLRLKWDEFQLASDVWLQILEHWYSEDRSRFDKTLYLW